MRHAAAIAQPPRVVEWRDLLLENGRLRSWEETIAIFGSRATQYAHVQRAIEQAHLRPPTLSSPERIFLAYRHGRPEHQRWVSALADELNRRGYTAVFDRASVRKADAEISDIVAGIAGCHTFVLIINPGLIESVSDVEGERGTGTWVYLEWRVAQLLVERFGVRIVGFLIEGDAVPRGMVLSDGVNPGTAFRVDTAAGLEAVLDLLFPASRPVDAAAVADTSMLVGTSREASYHGDHVDALQLARRAVARLPDHPDVHLRRCLAALAMTELDEGLESARRAAVLAPTRTFVRFAHILAELAAGHDGRAGELADEVSRVFSGSWRLKCLQLGIEAARGERHAMRSCARAVARMAPWDLPQLATSWRQAKFGVAENNLDTCTLREGHPVPVAGADFSVPQFATIHQIDRAVEVPGTDLHWVPTLLMKEPDLGPPHLSDLDALLFAYCAASWLSEALRGVGWNFLEAVDRQAQAGPLGLRLLLRDGRLIEVSAPAV